MCVAGLYLQECVGECVLCKPLGLLVTAVTVQAYWSCQPLLVFVYLIPIPHCPLGMTELMCIGINVRSCIFLHAFLVLISP